MNYVKTCMFHTVRCTMNGFKKPFVLNNNNLRHYSEYTQKLATEKSINNVTLLGRVGINPQVRGTESKPIVTFTLATNMNYKYDTGEMHQKTDWHRITVFKPYLRDTVMEYLKKGARVYVEGRIMYGEYCDPKGVVHNTTSIVANDIVFLSGSEKKSDEDTTVDEQSIY